MQRITEEYIQGLIPKRDATSHKYKNGFILTFVGSKQYPGAARLCCHGAARAGAGGIYAILPESLWPIIGALPAEIIPVMIQEHDGVISVVDAMEKFLGLVEKTSAILVGSGIGRHAYSKDLVKSIVTLPDKSCVIDGDGLYILGQLGEEFLINNSQGRWVLTPHLGEWHTLLQTLGYNITISPKVLATKWGCTILLKGFPTHIYASDGHVYVNMTGNPAATTAGCGDLLAGVIAGYIAQGVGVAQGACIGIFKVGQAADEVVALTGCHSVMATDILGVL